MKSFSIATGPRLLFGAGERVRLPGLIAAFGKRPLFITGARSFQRSPNAEEFWSSLSAHGFSVRHFIIPHEPTPQLVDSAVTAFASDPVDVVVAIGGGSVLDAGKAISAMLPLKAPVKDYLEGVGQLQHPGVKVPFIALPTTAGTGSEATKNAVLSEVGPGGYKKSLRNDRFVPDIALVDPQLSASCPPGPTAASGMDAFTQLLESYLSPNANPVTDALAYEGLKQVARALPEAYHHGDNLDARGSMSLAAYLSGITLANAGLGLVHGFASAVGGYFDIPHGVICSRLMPASNRITVRRLRKEAPGHGALVKYAEIGQLFTGQPGNPAQYNIDALLAIMDKWVNDMAIPSLTSFSVGSGDHERIVAATDNKNNPVKLTADEMLEVLELAG